MKTQESKHTATRILTAEGWKRMQKRKQKKTPSPAPKKRVQKKP